MQTPSLTADDLDRLGPQLYDEIVGPALAEDHKGQFIVIDVVSRDFEVADSDLDATTRLEERRPNGVFWGTRIGYSAASEIGIGFGA